MISPDATKIRVMEEMVTVAVDSNERGLLAVLEAVKDLY